MPSEQKNCIDCTNVFFYTEKDQEFYEKMNFTPPKRCFDCRAKKKKMLQEREVQDPVEN